MNTITANDVLNEVQQVNDELKIRDLIWGLAGDENRFFRQEVMQSLTGEKLPLVKCGVNALFDAAMAWLAKQAEPLPVEAEHEATPAQVDYTELVGKNVTRKCGATGIVEAFWDSKFTIKLADGRIKKPGVVLFQKNYKY